MKISTSIKNSIEHYFLEQSPEMEAFEKFYQKDVPIDDGWFPELDNDAKMENFDKRYYEHLKNLKTRSSDGVELMKLVAKRIRNACRIL